MKRTITLGIIALTIAFLIGGCSKQNNTGSAPAPMPVYENAPAEAPPIVNANAPGGVPMEQSDSENTVPLPLLTPSNLRGKRLIYTVDLQLQTTGFKTGIRTLLNTVSRMDGYVDSAEEYGWDLHLPETERSAKYKFRLNSERLADFLMAIEDNYNVMSLKQSSEDVTVDYEYSDSTINDLRDQETRLLNELNNANLETTKRLEVEKRLSDIQANIRNYERQQSNRDDNVLYSTVNVQLFEVIFVEYEEEEEIVIPELTFGERFSNAASKSAKGFVAFCQGFVIVLIRIAPTIIVIAVLALIALLIYRRVKKHRKGRKPTPKTNAASTQYTTLNALKEPVQQPLYPSVQQPPYQPVQQPSYTPAQIPNQGANTVSRDADVSHDNQNNMQ